LITTPWKARAVSALIDQYESDLPSAAWPNCVLGNHDRSRVGSRVGPAQARLAAMLLLTLRGTPTLYNGDEIGMPDVSIPPDAVRDPFERNVPGRGFGGASAAIRNARQCSGTPVRTRGFRPRRRGCRSPTTTGR